MSYILPFNHRMGNKPTNGMFHIHNNHSIQLAVEWELNHLENEEKVLKAQIPPRTPQRVTGPKRKATYQGKPLSA